MKRLFLYLTAVLLTVQHQQSFAQGAGSGLNFTGQSLQSASVTHNIGTGNFTWEAWVRPSVAANATSGTGTGIMANGNYSPAIYASSGGTAPATGFGSFGMYWSGIGGTTWKNSGVKLTANKWSHVAVVRNGTNLYFYVNGVLAPLSYTINATASLANAPVRLGYSGDGAESLNGHLDEVRMWSVARTEAELRANMCQKLTGAEAGLKVYYRLDEGSGTAIANTAAAGGAAITIPATGAPAWVSSEAPVGDTSAQLYTTSFGTQSVVLGSAANGSVTVNNISNSSNGIHLYRVNSVPNTTTGIPNPGSNNVYYGVFNSDTATGASGSTYNVQYNYTGFPDALTFASGINLYNRTGANGGWTLSAAVHNKPVRTFQLTNTSDRQEMIVGNFANTVVCTAPATLNATAIATRTATLSWITGGSNKWNFSWAPGTSFTPASGTVVRNLAATTYNLSGLTANTTYSFYVQDTCAAINSSSPWAGPYTFTTTPDVTMAAGTGLYFNGSETILSTANINYGIDSNDFTWEAWINPSKITGSTGFMANGNFVPGFYASTAGAGGNGSVGFYWGGWKNSNTFIEKDKWSHVAMVRANDTITIYVNGIAAPNRFRMTNTMTPARLRLGYSGDASEYFQGVLDEVRVWKVARTEAQLRAYMCQKLQGNETGLVNYLPLNEGTGTVATDVTGTAVFNTVTAARWRVSGAAIGDTSLYVYPSGWNGTSLSMGSTAMGTFTVDSVAGNVKGIHVYRVNSRPNYAAGIQNPGGTNQYFGVFAPGDYNSAGYRMRYDYSTYSAAVANKANLHVYNRKDNSVTRWSQTPAANNTTGNYLQQRQSFGARQYVIADFVAAACSTPVNAVTAGIDTSNATVSLTSAAANHAVEYGEVNFVPGTGTRMDNSALNIALTGLQPARTYDYYVKDSCSATSNSAWAGPYSFTTLDPCPVPFSVYADSITATRIIVKWSDNGMVTQDYTVSWGLRGFGDPNIGILNNVSAKRFALGPVTANTAYDFYIQANCNSSKLLSGWVGPFSYTTLACNVPDSLNIINLTSTTATVFRTGGAAQYNVQYGPAGFAPGTGNLQTNITARNYVITGLQANTAYDAYVQDSCSAVLGSSKWVGPLNFKTLQSTGISAVGQGDDITIFPNPAAQNIMLKTNGTVLEKVWINNSMGQLVMAVSAEGKNTITCSVSTLPSGIYYIEMLTATGARIIRKIAVQH